MHRSVSAVLVLVSLSLSGCHADAAASPTPLIGPLTSRMSAIAVREALGVPEARWEAKQESAAAVSSRPQYTVTTVRVAAFADLGVNGWLGLSFFNDALMKAEFFPDDVARYVSRLEADKKLQFRSSNEARIQPNTRVWIGKALGSETQYVGWEDVTLTEEYHKAVS